MEYIGVHVLVLVHGYGGSPASMHDYEEMVRFLYPNTIVFASSANHEHTEDGLFEMGRRLAR